MHKPARIKVGYYRYVQYFSLTSGIHLTEKGCQSNGISSQFFRAPRGNDYVEAKKMRWVEESLYPFRDWVFYKTEASPT